MPEVPCKHCMTPIEFPDEWAQQAIECPSCKQSTFLAVVKSEPDSAAARPPTVQFVPPPDAPTHPLPAGSSQNRQQGRVVTLSRWADKAQLGGAVIAAIGALVFVAGWRVVGGVDGRLTMLAGGIMLVIGLTVYFVFNLVYPQFSCSVCRKSLKDKSEKFCPTCGAELGGEVIGE